MDRKEYTENELGAMSVLLDQQTLLTSPPVGYIYSNMVVGIDSVRSSETPMGS